MIIINRGSYSDLSLLLLRKLHISSVEISYSRFHTSSEHPSRPRIPAYFRKGAGRMGARSLASKQALSGAYTPKQTVKWGLQ